MVVPVFGVRRQTVEFVCLRETGGFVYGSRAKMGSVTSLGLRERRMDSLALPAAVS